MSTRFKISTTIVLVAFACVIASGVRAQDRWHRQNRAEDLKFDESYTLDRGDRLNVVLQDSDVEIVQGDDARARVQVFVSARSGGDDADDYFEDARFRANVTDNTLLVETRFPRHRHWGHWDYWGHDRHVRMHVVVTIPNGTYARVRTRDGDIFIEKLEGDLRASTSDGDVIVGTVHGSVISLKTSDGDIRAEDLKADEVRIRSSDGDVRAKRIQGEIIVLSTSDGDVVIGRAEGETISMSTSDGDIRVQAVAKKVSARTSDGNINVAITGNTALNLRTSDGNVRITAPAKLKADLDLRGERVSVGGATVEGEVGRRRVLGSVGGGGASIVVRTSDGSISLDLR